ncbi:2-C-methyl-D-erythritol 4-phosphate cytidylyltransferase [Cytophagaceae bacterium ABcell3]|nr:2-C-methyl-D-erythritol 4-phosphate cytidylyltransferase [Cytophagaceae bacterium ABcell3]
MEILNRYAIIVAGGSGTRMNSSVPKQFLKVAGKPILMHTIEKFIETDPQTTIVLVLPLQEIATWKSLVKKHQFKHQVQIAEGGRSRFASVKNGLKVIEEEEALVAIHDGVRPCISPETIERSYEHAAIYGSAITSVPLKDSIRLIKEKNSNEAVDRSMYRLIQTPQTFKLSLIRDSYQTTELPHFTDDASVAEHASNRIHLIEGSYLNLKITTPDDLVIAECLLSY